MCNVVWHNRCVVTLCQLKEIRQVLKVKTSCVVSVYCVTEYAMCSLVITRVIFLQENTLAGCLGTGSEIPGLPNLSAGPGRLRSGHQPPAEGTGPTEPCDRFRRFVRWHVGCVL
jgi:hypothetical protein